MEQQVPLVFVPYLSSLPSRKRIVLSHPCTLHLTSFSLSSLSLLFFLPALSSSALSKLAFTSSSSNAEDAPKCYWANLEDTKGNLLNFYGWIGPGAGSQKFLDPKCEPEQPKIDEMSAELYYFGTNDHPQWELRGQCVKSNGIYNADVRDTTGR